MSETAQIITALLGTITLLTGVLVKLVTDIIGRQDRQIESGQRSLQTTLDNAVASQVATYEIVKSVSATVAQLHQENRTALTQINSQLNEVRIQLSSAVRHRGE